MPCQPTSNRSSSVKCTECEQTMSVKSIKRHMAQHAGINYPCRHCDKTFTQAPNRAVHEKSHNGLILVCDVCEWSTRQNAEMTRHKQSQHGHPTRGEKGGVRIGHSVKTVVEVGVQRVRKCHSRFAPYTRTAPSTPPVYDVSPSASSTSFEEGQALSPIPFSPGYPLLSLSPSAQSSPELLWNHEQYPFPQQATDSQASGSSCDLDSSYSSCPDFPFAENALDDFEIIQAMIDSIPDPPSSPVSPSTPEYTPAMTWSPAPSSDQLACHSGPSPEEFSFFMEQLRSPEQVDRVRELDSWNGAPSGGGEFLNVPISQIFPGSLSILPQNNQCLLF